MKYAAASVLIALLLATILVSCIVVRDSKIDNSNLFREDIRGNKETGMDFDADCNQQIGDKCSDKKKE